MILCVSAVFLLVLSQPAICAPGGIKGKPEWAGFKKEKQEKLPSSEEFTTEKAPKIRKGKQVKSARHARNARRWLLKRLNRSLQQASGATVRDIAELYGNDLDSDEDTLPDWLELALGTSACLADTDGDGIDDNEEIDDDETVGGEGNENEVEVENTITELTETTLTVGGVIFHHNERDLS